MGLFLSVSMMRKEKVTILRFVKLATSGYAFCNLFRYDRDRLYRMKSGAFWNRCKAEYQRGRNKGAMKKKNEKNIQIFVGIKALFFL